MHFYTHVDYDRHMAFVCEAAARLVGEARYVANNGTRSCELGIVVADDWHHTGVAQLLLDALMRAAQARQLKTLIRDVHRLLPRPPAPPGNSPRTPARVRAPRAARCWRKAP